MARSNRLPILISEIKKYEGLARNHGKAWLMTRLDEGDRLRELKGSVEHGRWLPLLAELGIHEMRARRYMRVAEHRALIEAKSDSESDFGLTDALNCITDLEERKKREADKEFQARRQKREEQNRKLLASELERRAAEKPPAPGLLPGFIIIPGDPELPPPPPTPEAVARAVTSFTHCVSNWLAVVGLDQRAEFLKQARGVLDEAEQQHQTTFLADAPRSHAPRSQWTVVHQQPLHSRLDRLCSLRRFHPTITRSTAASATGSA